MIGHEVELFRQFANFIVGLNRNSMLEIPATDLLGSLAKSDNRLCQPPA